MTEWTQVRRDPFARASLVRRRVYAGEDVASPVSCSWCGNLPRTKGGRAYLFQYGLLGDGRAEPSPFKGLFDGLPCLEGYYGGEVLS